MFIMPRLVPFVQDKVAALKISRPNRRLTPRSGRRDRLLVEISDYVQQFHLGRNLARLEHVYTHPSLLAPLPPADPYKTDNWGISQINYVWPDVAHVIAPTHLPDLTIHQLLVGARRVAVSAGAGTGKTTLLAYCAYRYATAVTGELPDDYLETIPVFVHLAELDLEAESSRTDPMLPLVTAVEQQVSERARNGLYDVFQQKLKSDKLLLLLDGWDDLHDHQQPMVSNWLTQLITDHPPIRIIMSVGLKGYAPLVKLSFFVVGILPWQRSKHINTFVKQWSEVLEREEEAFADILYVPGQPAIEATLRLLLEVTQEVDVEARPNDWRWTDLFQATLVQYFAKQKSVETALDQQQIVEFWQLLAYELIVTEQISIPNGRVMALAEKVWPSGLHPEYGESEDEPQVDWLSSTLLIQAANGHVRFLSSLWRDFLAASYIVQNELHTLIDTNLQDKQWAYVIRFYIGLVGGERLSAVLLESKDETLTHENLFQLASWIREAPDDNPWRQQVLVLLGQMVRKPNYAPILRQRAVAALTQTREQGTFTFIKQLLVRSDPLLREAGTAALPYLADGRLDEVISLLDAKLEDNESLVRQAAVNALIWLNHEKSEKLLISVLLEQDEDMGRAVAEGLASNGGEGVEIVREAVEDEASHVRRAAVRGLALLDEDWVVPLLQDIERNDEWSVRSVASAAVELVRGRKEPAPWHVTLPNEQPWLTEYASQQREYVPEEQAAVGYLARILAKSPTPVMRVAAVMSLGQIVGEASQAVLEKVVPILEAATEDADQSVKDAAFTALCLVYRVYDL